MSGLATRLDKGGGRVICGMRDCGAELARIVEVLHEDQPLRLAYFPLGWRPRASDGTWALTRHAAERMRRGRPPAYARRPAWPDGRRILGVRLDAATAQAVCPACGSIQTLAAEALRFDVLPEAPALRGRGQQPDPGLLILRDR